MTHTAKMIEAARRLLPTKTDYAVCKALGLNQSDFPGVLDGSRLIGNTAAYKLAEIVGADPAYVIARVEEDRAALKNDEQKKKFWREQANKFAGGFKAATITAIAFGAGILGLLHSPATHALSDAIRNNCILW